MMMSYGMFPFEIGTLAFQELTRSRAWRFGRTPRFGTREASQFLGPGDDKVTLAGAIIPGLSGAFWSVEKLAQTADEGLAWPLVTGTGSVLGHYVVDAIEHKESTFFVEGQPRKGDFTITLTRVADDAKQQSSAGKLSAFQSLGLDAPAKLEVPIAADRIQQRLGALNMSLPDLSSAAGVPLQALESFVSSGLSQGRAALSSLAPVPTLSQSEVYLVAHVLDVAPDWLTGAVDQVSGNG
jgi:phage protein U